MGHSLALNLIGLLSKVLVNLEQVAPWIYVFVTFKSTSDFQRVKTSKLLVGQEQVQPRFLEGQTSFPAFSIFLCIN